jgi:hypothetical protein
VLYRAKHIHPTEYLPTILAKLCRGEEHDGSEAMMIAGAWRNSAKARAEFRPVLFLS